MSKEFYVDPDLCTSCGECWESLPQYFKDVGGGTAGVHNTQAPPEEIKKVEDMMKKCPGEAILWKP